MRVPFGKFRGALLENLPDDYLDWLASRELREPLRGRVMAEHERRCASRDTTNAPAVYAELASQIVAAGYRALAMKLHPDHGGSHDSMVALGRAKAWLAERTGG